MPARTIISYRELAKHPYAMWNGFLDVMMDDPSGFSPPQKKARLCLTYEGQVQNGGHFQFFENYGLQNAREAHAALVSLGFLTFAVILEDAIARAAGRRWGNIQRVEDFVAGELEGTLDEFDNRFYSASPTLAELLEEHVKANRDEYFTFVN